MFVLNQSIAENLNEFWSEFSSNPIFERYESHNLLALKAQIKMTGIHFVWGNVTKDSILAIKEFFQEIPITWFLNADQMEEGELLEQAGFEKSYITPEMSINLDQIEIMPVAPEISIQQVTTLPLLKTWAKVAAQEFGLPIKGILEFVTPTLNSKNQHIYLAFWDGKPAGTAITYLASRSAGLYFLSVDHTLRKKGIGTALTQTCLLTAQDRELAQAVLYASDIAYPLYQKMGFQVINQQIEFSYSKS